MSFSLEGGDRSTAVSVTARGPASEGSASKGTKRSSFISLAFTSADDDKDEADDDDDAAVAPSLALKHEREKRGDGK